MFRDDARERTDGTDGVATARPPDTWGKYLAGQIARGEIPIDCQVQPNTTLPPEPARYVPASSWQAWVIGRRRALGGRS